MGLIEAIRKVKSIVARRHQEGGERPRKISNEEYELNIFLERDRQKAIKAELAQYRKRENEDMFGGENMLNQPSTFKQKPTLISQKKAGKVLHSRNAFWK